jgi:ubiquinone/menaquinone biosynthesis C-methylase UbiE
MADGRTGWSELAAEYDRTRAFPGDGERFVPADLERLLRSLGARRVLDLGCGTGRFAVPLAAAGVSVVGVDQSSEMLAMLRAKPGGDAVAVVRGDAERLPLRRAADVVLFSHFLHFFPTYDRLAAELRRALVPGGHLVVVDTSSGPRPASLRALSIVMPLLEPNWSPWPDGDSRDRQHFRRLLAALDGEELDVVPGATFPATTSLRELLAAVRARTWWTCRVHDAADVARAADAAERRLVAEGADLDARVEEPVVVRFLVGRLRTAD